MTTLEKEYSKSLNSIKERMKKDGRDAVYMGIAGYRKDNGKDYYTVGEIYDALSSREGELYNAIIDALKKYVDYENSKTKEIIITENNFQRYAECCLHSTIEYKKSNLDLDDESHKHWIFLEICKTFYDKSFRPDLNWE